MIMFGGGALPAERRAPPAPPPTAAARPRGAPGRPRAAAAGDPPATEQLIAAGWGFASLSPTSIQADNGAGLTQRHHRPRQQGPAAQAGRLGRAARLGVGRVARRSTISKRDTAVDAKRVGIEGVSRYGKAALVTMAFDPRFAVVLVGSSGEGGAKLHRRNFGEAVENLTGCRRIPLDGRQLPEVRRGRMRRSAARTPATSPSMRTS